MNSVEAFIESYKEILGQQFRDSCPKGSNCNLTKANAYATKHPEKPDLHQVTASLDCTTGCPYTHHPSKVKAITEVASQLAIQHSETSIEVNFFE